MFSIYAREKSSPRDEFISAPGAMRKTFGLSHYKVKEAK